MVQVLGTWRWAAYMTDQCAVLGKVPLRIDMLWIVTVHLGNLGHIFSLRFKYESDLVTIILLL